MTPLVRTLHLQESPGPLGPISQKNLRTGPFGGLKNTPKSPTWVLKLCQKFSGAKTLTVAAVLSNRVLVETKLEASQALISRHFGGSTMVLTKTKARVLKHDLPVHGKKISVAMPADSRREKIYYFVREFAVKYLRIVPVRDSTQQNKA